jgi:hypothetical protein
VKGLDKYGKTKWCFILSRFCIFLFIPVLALIPTGALLFNINKLWDVRPVAQIPVNPEDARAMVAVVPVDVTGLMFMTGLPTCPSATRKAPAESLRLVSTRVAVKNSSAIIPFRFL